MDSLETYRCPLSVRLAMLFLLAIAAVLLVSLPVSAERAILIQEVTFDEDGPFRAGEQQEVRITVKDVGGSKETGHRECFGIRIFLNDAGQPQHTLSESFSLANNDEREFVFPFDMKNDGDYSYYVRVYDIGAYQNCQYWNEGYELDEFPRTFMFTAGNRAPALGLVAPDAEFEVALGAAQAFTAQCTDADDAQNTLSMTLSYDDTEIDARQRLVNTGADASETFAFNDPGEYTIVAQCSDDEDAVSTELAWTVRTENQVPVASRIAPAAATSADVGDTVRFTLQCDDVDGDPMTATIISRHPDGSTSQEADSIASGAAFSIDIAMSLAGEYEAEGVCSDEYAENSVVWSVAVAAADSEPTGNPAAPDDETGEETNQGTEPTGDADETQGQDAASAEGNAALDDASGDTGSLNGSGAQKGSPGLPAIMAAMAALALAARRRP